MVVYTGFKASADALASALVLAGVSAAAYHAGKRQELRQFIQASLLACLARGGGLLHRHPSGTALAACGTAARAGGAGGVGGQQWRLQLTPHNTST